MERHGWMVTAMWMAASATCLSGQERLAVVLFDSVGIEEQDTKYAVEQAEWFFQNLGIPTGWTVCRSLASCPMPSEGSFVRVSLVAWTKGTLLGFARMDSAAGGNPQVYVFEGAVRKAAGKDPFARALACVMVHEILHSLGLEHAPYGIMRDTVGTQELARFLKGPAMPGYQLKQLRAGLARLRPASAVAKGN
ncbi:MAG: hypothetical protein ACKV22_11630 [Bryobacteraceae bacterium]